MLWGLLALPLCGAAETESEDTAPAAESVAVAPAEILPAEPVATVEEGAPPASESVVAAEADTAPVNEPVATAPAETSPVSEPVAVAPAEDSPESEPVAAAPVEDSPASEPVAAAPADEDSPVSEPVATAPADTLPESESVAAAPAETSPASEAVATAPADTPPESEPVAAAPVEDSPASEPVATAPANASPANDPVASQDEEVIVNYVKGVVLVDSQDHLLNAEDLSQVQGIVSHVDLPERLVKLEARLDPICLHKPLTSSKLKQIKQAIADFYIDNGRPLVLVTVPKQRVSDGVVQVVVTEAHLGKITVEGNNWTRADLITQYLHVAPGDVINMNRLQNDLSFINRNPFRRVNIIYAPGTEAGTTDLVLAMEERRPFRFYGGADNTGLERINRQRLFTGLTLNRVLGFDHYFSYQFTTSYDIHRFRGHTAQYVAMLPWEHDILIYGGYSSAHGHLAFPTMSNEAKSAQASIRYEMPVVLGRSFHASASLGFDFKNTNSTLLFTETYVKFSSSNVNLSQFVAELTAAYEGTKSRIEFNTQGYWSPGALLHNESNAMYNSLRPGARNRWLYGKAAIRFTHSLPNDFNLTIWGRGQWANRKLLPSEQATLGGYSTVRGYDENQLAMDNCAIANVELRTCPISMVTKIRRFTMKDALQFLVFFDYAWATNHGTAPAEASPIYLMSVGPGLRYTMDPYFAARLDWGWKLHKQSKADQPFTGGPSMLHFSTTLSY